MLTRKLAIDDAALAPAPPAVHLPSLLAALSIMLGGSIYPFLMMRADGTAHHALALACRHLRRHPGAQPVVLVVTDGEPTAHLESFGSAGQGSSVFFDYPPHPRTIAHTVRGFDEVARMGAQVTIFRLGDDPGLARFIDQVARRVEGRVVVPDLDGLGAAVVGDYLRSRRRRR